MIEQIGPVPKNCKWTTVGDRGADIFSFVESLPQEWDCVIRSKHDRKIVVNDKKQSLKKYMRGLLPMGTTTHFLRARNGAISREITLNISWAEVEILPPSAHKEKKSIKGSYVRAWCEEDSDIEWILFTRSSITSFEDALEIVTIYRHRWLIEEYHKCLKTGCQIEKVQLGTADRLLNSLECLGLLPRSFFSLSASVELIPMNLRTNMLISYLLPFCKISTT